MRGAELKRQGESCVCVPLFAGWLSAKFAQRHTGKQCRVARASGGGQSQFSAGAVRGNASSRAEKWDSPRTACSSAAGFVWQARYQYRRLPSSGTPAKKLRRVVVSLWSRWSYVARGAPAPSPPNRCVFFAWTCEQSMSGPRGERGNKLRVARGAHCWASPQGHPQLGLERASTSRHAADRRARAPRRACQSR